MSLMARWPNDLCKGRLKHTQSPSLEKYLTFPGYYSWLVMLILQCWNVLYLYCSMPCQDWLIEITWMPFPHKYTWIKLLQTNYDPKIEFKKSFLSPKYHKIVGSIAIFLNISHFIMFYSCVMCFQSVYRRVALSYAPLFLFLFRRTPHHNHRAFANWLRKHVNERNYCKYLF